MKVEEIPIKRDAVAMQNPSTEISAEEFNAVVNQVIENKEGIKSLSDKDDPAAAGLHREIYVEVENGRLFVRCKDLSNLIKNFTPYIFRKLKTSHGRGNARYRHKGWHKYGCWNSCKVASNGEVLFTTASKTLMGRPISNVNYSNEPSNFVNEKWRRNKDGVQLYKVISWGHKRIKCERNLHMPFGIAFVANADKIYLDGVNLFLVTNIAPFYLRRRVSNGEGIWLFAK